MNSFWTKQTFNSLQKKFNTKKIIKWLNDRFLELILILRGNKTLDNYLMHEMIDYLL
jgi:hypothetical protein